MTDRPKIASCPHSWLELGIPYIGEAQPQAKWSCKHWLLVAGHSMDLYVKPDKSLVLKRSCITINREAHCSLIGNNDSGPLPIPCPCYIILDPLTSVLSNSHDKSYVPASIRCPTQSDSIEPAQVIRYISFDNKFIFTL